MGAGLEKKEKEKKWCCVQKVLYVKVIDNLKRIRSNKKQASGKKPKQKTILKNWKILIPFLISHRNVMFFFPHPFLIVFSLICFRQSSINP